MPVAQVCVDLPLPHLDRPFDYLVPAADADAAQPGVRVRVRFAGQLVDGWLLSRAAESSHTGRLAFLDRVVSAEPVLRPEVLAAARAVAARYAGNLADVLRLAVPPRHARTESTPKSAPIMDLGTSSAGSEAPNPMIGAEGAEGAEEGGWRAYSAGPALLRALAEQRPARAVWTALPGEAWPARVAEAIAATVAGGRGAVAVVADARDLARLDAEVTAALGPDQHVALAAAIGPAERYRRFLRAARGEVPVVIGNRAAALAPMADLGLVAIWDDGDDLHAEPRAPYPHAREMLLIRAQQAGAAALLGGFTRTAEAQQLLMTGWAKPVAAERVTLRRRAPVVTPIGDEPQLARDPAAAAARLPSEAWRAARGALAAGAPVLVQVPRRGYLPAVACGDCRAPARCPHCGGPLQLAGAGAAASCRWCARPVADRQCPECGSRRLRAAVTGARRTAEELGRAFPGHPVRTSGRGEVLASVPGEPTVVVCTPGAEPVADGGYGAVLLLDTWALLTRADLRAGEETLRRWLAAAGLARPAGDGGRVVVVADGGLPAVQALLRFDPGWYAERELAERRSLGFPPTARVASVTGPADAVVDLLAAASLPDGTELLGPVPIAAERPDEGEPAQPRERMLVRASRANGEAMAAALHAAAGVRSARKALDPVRIQVDPLELL
ncbi:primosomal protein N' [Natronosporangium hydrolyticum]|uniref:Probable replication restart protein PriA n=1 Tax=Natronosporangium hydrolyticum TaxID=2811111 RepID=A0A895YTB4_9ACTN|nr:primosomal protein N' [Natronosporangium hydrolyticum]QSB17278.1 primosomal protein N' [Natronosporangium hydrolyticum]